MLEGEVICVWFGRFFDLESRPKALWAMLQVSNLDAISRPEAFRPRSQLLLQGSGSSNGMEPYPICIVGWDQLQNQFVTSTLFPSDRRSTDRQSATKNSRLNVTMYGKAMGKNKEEFVLAAQSKSKNAHAASVAAALGLFRSQLEEDVASYEAMKIRPT